uniref:Uncharacterized protein n=1 Tax=Chlorobium chlorochromatii (strain CaD3) TaxID=340177 RepID=Q3ASP0_CHLCH
MATETQRAFDSELDSEAAELHLAQLIHEAGEEVRRCWAKRQELHMEKLHATVAESQATLNKLLQNDRC